MSDTPAPDQTPATLQDILETIRKREELLSIQTKLREEEKRREEGLHGFMYRDREPDKDPLQETEDARYKRLMNSRGAWQR